MAQPSGFETLSEGMAEASHYFDWIYHEIEPYLGKHVLEIGPGYGNLAQRILKSGRFYSAIDTDRDVLNGLRQRLGVAPDHLIHGDLADASIRKKVGNRNVDTVISMNVLEHIADDRAHVQALLQMLSSGRLIFFVPAHPFLFGSMDREAGHYRRYDKAALNRLWEGQEATVKIFRYFNALGVVAWWTAGRLLRCQVCGEGTKQSVIWYDRWFVPLARWIDPVFRWMTGQSLLAILEVGKGMP